MRFQVPLARAVSALGQLALTLALACSPGCSFLFVDGPPVGHEQMQLFDCTTSRLAPAADTVFAAAYGIDAAIVGVEAARGRDVGFGSSGGSMATAGVMLAVAGLDAASAAYGFSRTRKCRRAKQAWGERMRAAPSGGCGSDVDCKGERVCEAGLCVAPNAPQRTP